MGRPRFLRSVGSDTKATSIDTKARFDTDGNSVPAAAQGQTKGKPESELRAAAWRHGLNLKELVDRMGVNYGYLSPVTSGHRPWTPMLREGAMAALGEAPGQGVIYWPGGLVQGESTYIREQAREMGFSLKGLAEHVGMSPGYMTQVCRGQRNMSPAVQARVEAAMDAPARVEPAQRPTADPSALWDRMEAHDFSQNEVARRAGISSSHLSQIITGKSSPSPGVLKRLHGVLFQHTKAERVMPAELKVMAWEWQHAWRPHRSHRQPRALRRRGGVRLPRRVRQPGPGVGDSLGGREGLFRDADETGAGRCIVACCRDETTSACLHGVTMFRGLAFGSGTEVIRMLMLSQAEYRLRGIGHCDSPIRR